MSSIDKTITSVVNDDRRTIDSTGTATQIEMDEQYFDKKYTSFETIKTYLPIAISEDYRRLLPKNYIEDCINIASSYYKYFDTTEITDKNIITEYKERYNTLISNFAKKLKFITGVYSELYNCDEYSSKSFNIKYDIFTIRNDLIVKKVNSIETGDQVHYPISQNIKVAQFPNIENYIRDNNLVKRAKEDIKEILEDLAEISTCCQFYDNDKNDFRKFTTDIICSMYGNTTSLFPRSIINYTGIKFTLNDNYPYNTRSKKVYSISNYGKYNNKFKLLNINHKNLDAIFTFLSDIPFNNISNIQILKNSWGVLIALCAIIGENKIYENIMSNNPIIINIDISKSIFEDNSKEKINVVL